MQFSYKVVIYLLFAVITGQTYAASDVGPVQEKITSGSRAHIGRFIRAERENDSMYYTTAPQASLARAIKNAKAFLSDDNEFKKILINQDDMDSDGLKLILTNISINAQRAFDSNNSERVARETPISFKKLKISKKDYVKIKSYLKEAKHGSQKWFMGMNNEALRHIIDLAQTFLMDKKELMRLNAHINLTSQRLEERLTDLVINAQKALDLKSKPQAVPLGLPESSGV
jgi:hypothetical protein